MEKKVKLKLFGPLKKREEDFLIVTIKDNSTVSDLLNEIAEKLNLTDAQKNSIRIANDKGFLELEENIKDEELFLIPPVGGG